MEISDFKKKKKIKINNNNNNNCSNNNDVISDNIPVESTNDTGTEQHNGGQDSSLSSSSSRTSRLQLLRDHNIIQNVMLFLDEMGLFQLENAHSKIIGPLSFARQWSYLSLSEKNFDHRRWRSFNAEDMSAVVDGIKSTKINTAGTGTKDSNNNYNNDDDNKDSDSDITVGDYPCKTELLARHIGRNFAEEAIFLQEREKEASRIYNFDRTPTDETDIPISIDHRSTTDLSSSSSLSSQITKDQEPHWQEW